MYLLAGDVILTRSDTWLGRTIRAAERRPGDDVQYNHVGLCTRSGLVGNTFATPAIMTEALWHVRRGPVWAFYGPDAGDKRPSVGIYRPRGLDSGVRSRAADYAERFVGARYGWWKLLAHGVDTMLSRAAGRDVRLLRRALFIDGRPICSFLVCEAYAQSGFSFGVEPQTCSPDDIHDYILRHPTEWAQVYEGQVR